MQNELLQRADEVLADSQRLMDELRESTKKAEQLDQHLEYLLRLRREDRKK